MKLFTKAPPMYGLQANHSGAWFSIAFFAPAQLERMQAAAKSQARSAGPGLHATVLRIVLDDKTQRVLHHWTERDGWQPA